MIELENSENLQDRIKYHKFLKEALTRSNQMVETCDDEHLKELETKYIKVLKDKIFNYDIYRQKVIVKCRTCNEVECVCYVLKPEVQSEITEAELNKLF